ncbi:MAG: 7-cyano-7-deazaguanine synthase, partial [Rhodospirillales bacterium]
MPPNDASSDRSRQRRRRRGDPAAGRGRAVSPPATPPGKGAPGRAAVILLSGGLDSAVSLAIARAEGFRAHALTLRYGQRHE